MQPPWKSHVLFPCNPPLCFWKFGRRLTLPSPAGRGVHTMSLLRSDAWCGSLLVLWFDLTNPPTSTTHTQRHTAHSGASGLTHPYKCIYTNCYVLIAAIFITLNEKFTDIKNLLYRMSFLFKNYSLAKTISVD